MPVFDFQNTPNTPSSGVFTSGTSLSYVADGVTFTVSFSNPGGGVIFAAFGGTDSGGPPPFYLSDSQSGDLVTQADVIRLTLQGTANAFDRLLVGNATTPVALQLDDIYADGSFTIRFTDSVNGTATETFTNFTNNALLTATGTFTGITFTAASPGDDILTALSLSMASLECFCEGTAIATPQGSRAVEALAVGDHVLTADGRVVAVRWLGETRVDPQLETPEIASPVRIARGALGGALPENTLYLSPDHAVGIGGLLVNSGALVDGAGITRERRTEPFSYYHIETDAHELILAEGVPAETYLEHLAPQSFDNADERGARVVSEMDLPRVTSGRLLPDALRPGRAPVEAA